jgi:L-asparaginase II
LLAARTRSGLVETTHDGAVAVIAAGGELIAASGDIDRPFYLRSAAKPFQAAVAQRLGAGLEPVEMALASASHDGHPVHVAIVESMLAGAGLDDSSLGCPPSWPLSEAATLRYAAQGHVLPKPVWHNCSGKHAGWLRACQANGLPIDGYLAADHPLQTSIAEYLTELGEYPVDPVGVDGCGAPVLRTTTRAMALLFARLGALPDLREVFRAMHRYPTLVSGTGNGDAEIATSINAAAKRGAAGCIGTAIENRIGVAVKCWDGSQVAAEVAMIATLAALGELPVAASQRLAPLARPITLGGGKPVGAMEPMVELSWSG